MVACLTGVILVLTMFKSAEDWVTQYGSLTLTITGLVGVGIVIIKYPQWVLGQLLPPPIYERLTRVISRGRGQGEESTLLVQNMMDGDGRARSTLNDIETDTLVAGSSAGNY